MADGNNAASNPETRGRYLHRGGAVRRPVLFVHGGGEGAYEADEKLAASLRDALGDPYNVRCPRMPNEDSPEYGAWRGRISEELAQMDGAVILVGHSLGASILLKYLSEQEPGRPVAGVFLLATPFWGAEDWEVDEYALRRDFAAKIPEGVPVFLYHSRDDEVVPFEHLALYAQRLPRATLRELDGRGHQFNDDLSEVARDIEARSGAGGIATDVQWEDDLPPELSRPARRALVGAGYGRLDLLAALRESEAGELHGVGPKALGQLRRALDARGLSFADEDPDRPIPEEDPCREG